MAPPPEGGAAPALHVLRQAGVGLQRIPRAGAWVPLTAWAGLITWLSALPANDAATISPLGLWINLAHAFLFGILCLWMVLLLPREGGWPRLDRRASLGLLLAVALAGILDETHQALGGAGRDFSLLDLSTDLVGAAAVLSVVAYLRAPRATSGGLWGRLLAGTLACLAAAALATYVPRLFPAAHWM